MLRACKAPSCVQWSSKLHSRVFNVFFAVWRACKAPSRVQWYPKTAPSRAQCVFFAVWRACKAPSRVQWYPKTASSRVQCVFVLLFFCCRPHTRPRVSEKQTKKHPFTRTPHGAFKGTKARTPTEKTLYTKLIPGCTNIYIHPMQMSDSVPFCVM